MRTLLCLLLLVSACSRSSSSTNNTPPPAPRPATPTVPAAPEGCEATPNAGVLLDHHSDGISLAAHGSRAFLVSNWHRTQDPAYCSNHPTECEGNVAGHVFNPYVHGFLLPVTMSAAVQPFEPAHRAHRPGYGNGAAIHSDIGAAVARGEQLESIVFTTEYVAEDSYVVRGTTVGSMVDRQDLFGPRESDENPPTSVSPGAVAAAANGMMALGVAVVPRFETRNNEANPVRRGFLLRGYRFPATENNMIEYERTDLETPIDSVSLTLNEMHGALSWRAGGQLRLLVLDGAGRPVGRALTLSTVTTSRASLAWVGDELLVVWSQRAAEGQPERLRSVQWNPANGAPPNATELATGSNPASGPALALVGNRYALAWIEGSGNLRAGIGSSLSAAITRAIGVTSSGAAHDVAIALGTQSAWVAWRETIPATQNALADETVRAAILRCP